MTHGAKIGGKAANLAKLSEYFSVPEAFVILADEDIVAVEVLEWFDELGASTVAVRSSAANEDGADSAWAGQLQTRLNVSRNDVVDAIHDCRSSVQSARARAYSNFTESSVGSVAVIVQRMVNARVSGVTFTRHPVTNDNETVIEAVVGLGDALVSGLTTPETIIVSNNKRPDVLTEQQNILSKHEIAETAQLALGVEGRLGCPVDIEWVYEGNILYLLQARPITTL